MEHPWNGPFLGGFRALSPPNVVRFCWNLHHSYYSRGVRHRFKNFLKIQIFTEIGLSQSLHLFLVFVQLWDRFSPWRRPKSGNLIFFRTKLRHRAIQKLQNQGPILSQFFRKNTITFCPILAVFWWKKGRGHTLKARNQNLTYPVAVSQFWGMFQSKKVGPRTSQFGGYRCQRSFFFQFQTTFSSLAAFLGTTPTFFLKNEFDFWVQNLILSRLAPNSNFKTLK